MKFQAVVLQSGKTATGLRVPPDIIAALGSHKRPAIRVTIGAHSYPSTVGVMQGEYMIPLSAENRALAGVAAGDEVEVDIELDTQPREVSLPPDFLAALSAEPAAKQFFEGLSYSQQRWFVLGVTDAKTPETRERRIGKALERLREGRGQR